MPKDMHVVVVDDDLLILTLLKEILETHQVKTTVFDNSPEAMDFIDSNQDVSIVVSDINMPCGCGIEICRQLSNPKSKNYLPVLLISASTDSDTILRSYDAGCFDFIPKPIEPDELIAKLSSASMVFNKFKKMETKAERSKTTAFDAMKNCNQMQNIIDLAYSCRHINSLSDLAAKTFETFELSQIKVSLLFFRGQESWFFSHDDHSKPLETKLMGSLIQYDKLNTQNRFLDIGNRLFVKYDSFIGFIKTSDTQAEDFRDYVATIFNFVDAQAQFIFAEEARAKAVRSERIHVLEEFGESVSSLSSVFANQMSSISGITDMIMSELAVKFSSLDICPRTEEVIEVTIQQALLDVLEGIQRGGTYFDATTNKMLHKLQEALLNLDEKKLSAASDGS